jgi:hypothetical protein
MGSGLVPNGIATKTRGKNAEVLAMAAGLRPFLIASAASAALAATAGTTAAGSNPPASPQTFEALGNAAMDTLTGTLYAGDGRWKACLQGGCPAIDHDWGADALTYALYLRWNARPDARAFELLRAIAAALPDYPPCRLPGCTQWSDVPSWDAIAALRAYQATGDPAALERARAAYASVADSDAYGGGACPEIRFQRPPLVRARDPAQGAFKTLETDANALKAALLLYEVTREDAYRSDALSTYAAIRRNYLDPEVPLYTVYVEDRGGRCAQLPHRFFASVNGDMIWSGLALARATGEQTYGAQAIASAQAVDGRLADSRGVFADLQAENDVAEPLVEAMLELATREPERGRFARDWILRNASAAAGARRPDGTYGRFFDGPPPRAPATAWQTNGALALAIAAAQLAPDAIAGGPPDWTAAQNLRVSVRTETLPAELTFTGSGAALIGTLGERCCQIGHARVLVDGVETFDDSGIWQNKSSSGQSLRDSVLFAWRWPAAGPHHIEILPGEPNGKEGGAFADIRRMLVAP